MPLFGRGREQSRETQGPNSANARAPQPAALARPRQPSPLRRPPAQSSQYQDDFDDNADAYMDRRPTSSPKVIAHYLISLKPQVTRAIEVRQSWIKELGKLFEDVRQGSQPQLTARASKLGRDHVGSFREIRAMVERQRPPEGCQEVFKSVFTWVDNMVKASESLIEVGNTNSLAGLQVTQGHVSDARHAARRFNSEYNRLVTDLRVAVRNARRAAGPEPESPVKPN